MTDEARIAEIAAGLTPRQRLWLSEPDNDAYFWCPDGRVMRGMEQKGLIEASHRSSRQYTKTGLAVRKHIGGE